MTAQENNAALKNAGLKVTLPRLKILELLRDPQYQHVTAEDLYKKLLDLGEEIGLATVYRVLNQFDDAGIKLTYHSLYLYGHCADGDCKQDPTLHHKK